MSRGGSDSGSEPDLDADQLSFLARRPAPYEMTQKLAGEAAPNLLLSVPAQETPTRPGAGQTLVYSALGEPEDVRVRVNSAMPSGFGSGSLSTAPDAPAHRCALRRSDSNLVVAFAGASDLR